MVSFAGLLKSDSFSSFFSLQTVLTLQVDVKTEVLSYVCLMLKNLLFLYPFFPKDGER